MLHRGYGQSKKNDTITIIAITGVLRKEMSTLYVPVFIRRAVINCRAVMSSTVSCRRCHLSVVVPVTRHLYKLTTTFQHNMPTRLLTASVIC